MGLEILTDRVRKKQDTKGMYTKREERKPQSADANVSVENMK